MTCIGKFQDVFLGCDAPEGSAPLGSYGNPHKIQASFNPPPHQQHIDPRPHINIKINNHVFEALLDTGASLCLINHNTFAKLEQCKSMVIFPSAVYITDCHSNTNQSEGHSDIKFDIIKSTTNKTTLLNCYFNFHVMKELSSDMLLGIDFLYKFGGVINTLVDPPISFHPREAKILQSHMHPLFMEAMASSCSFQEDTNISRFISNGTFAVASKNDISIMPGDSAIIKAEICTSADKQFRPGATVVLSGPDCSYGTKAPLVIPQFTNIQNNNTLAARFFNKTPFIQEIKAKNPIQGIMVQSAAVLHTPIEITKHDLRIMALADVTIDMAIRQASDPKFSVAFCHAALERNIKPNAPTLEQSATDQELFNLMKSSYKLACASLRATGIPPPGQRSRPTTPCPEAKKVNILSKLKLNHLDKHWKEAYTNMVLANYDIFSSDRYDLGHAPHFEHKIDPVPGAYPPFKKQFKIPLADEQVLDQMATNLTAAGVLIPANSTGNSPIFLVRKPGTTSQRVVQDYRAANQSCLPDRYMTANTRESIIKAGRRKPKVYSSVDLTGAFHQMSLAEESRPWSAFTLPFRGEQFVWARLPMGLRGATSSFARLTNLIFKSFEDVVTYIDDVLGLAQNHHDMIELLNKIFAELRYHGLKVNLEKSQFGLKNIKYLGFLLTPEGIMPDEGKLEKLRALQPPKSSKEIESVLPFLQFNAQCVEQFQNLAAPLADLTRQNSSWRSVARHGPLPKDAMEAFLTIKAMLLESPMVAYPDTSLPFALHCDASVGSGDERGGIGAVLTQNFDGVTKPIGYFSRRMRDSELRYSAFNAEMCSVVNALEHWEQLLKGSDLVVMTDHLPLVNHSTRDSKTMTNLLQKIISFDCQLVHLIGSENLIADYLSRHLLDDHIQDPPNVEQAEKIASDCPKTSPSQTQKNQNKQNIGTVPQSADAHSAAVCSTYNSKQTADPATESVSKQTKINKDVKKKPAHFSAIMPKFIKKNLQDPTIPNSIKQALLAKKQKLLGLVGSLNRFKAKGIASALAVLDISCQKVWKQHQKEDVITSAIINFLTFNQLPRQGSNIRSFVMDIGHKCTLDDQGILYYFGNSKNSATSRRLYVPHNLRLPVISESHGSAVAGHWSPETTVGNLLASYYWPTLATDVKDHIEKCPQCFIKKDKLGTRSKTKLNPLSTPPRPNFRVHCDLVGPLRSITDHHWVLSMVDALTKWTVLVPLFTKEAAEVAAAIVNHWILPIGKFEHLVTDKGSEFTSSVTKAILTYFETKLHTTAAYAPNANGQAERIHRELNSYLTIYSNSIGTDWVDFLPPLCHSLNAKVHSSTGFSPFFLHFGRHPLHQNWRMEDKKAKYSENEAISRLNLIQFAIDMVKDNDAEAKQAFKKAFDKKAKDKQFAVGDFCLLFFPPGTGLVGGNKKFVNNWRGIYIVREVCGSNTYKVAKPHGRSTKVPGSRLKPFNAYIHQEDREVLLSPEDDEDVLKQFGLHD